MWASQSASCPSFPHIAKKLYLTGFALLTESNCSFLLHVFRRKKKNYKLVSHTLHTRLDTMSILKYNTDERVVLLSVLIPTFNKMSQITCDNVKCVQECKCANSFVIFSSNHSLALKSRMPSFWKAHLALAWTNRLGIFLPDSRHLFRQAHNSASSLSVWFLVWRRLPCANDVWLGPSLSQVLMGYIFLTRFSSVACEHNKTFCNKE